MKLKKHVANAGVICCTIALCAAVAACSPATDGANPNTAEDTAVSEIVNASPTDPYVSDEVCLSCHGGTYEAVAQLTDAYGDSNPMRALMEMVRCRAAPVILMVAASPLTRTTTA